MALQTWNMTERDLAVAIAGHRLAVVPHSPLASARPPGEGPRFPKPIDPDLLQAIRFVASARVEIGLILSPPADCPFLWYYRGDQQPTDRLAGYRQGSSGSHELGWTSSRDLVDTISEGLQLDAPPGPPAPLLRLSREAFVTLLGLVDAHRESTLRSLVDRVPAEDRPFHPGRVLDSLERGRSSEDLRWLVGLAQILVPLDSWLGSEDCERGLEELAGQGLLSRDGDDWTLTLRMRALSALLGTPVAYCGVHRRESVPDAPMKVACVFLLRTLGGLWVARFPGLGTAEARVELSGGDPADVELALAEIFDDGGEVPIETGAVTDSKLTISELPPELLPSDRTMADAAPTLVGGLPARCPTCGRQLLADEAGCPHCDAKLAPASALFGIMDDESADQSEVSEFVLNPAISNHPKPLNFSIESDDESLPRKATGNTTILPAGPLVPTSTPPSSPLPPPSRPAPAATPAPAAQAPGPEPARTVLPKHLAGKASEPLVLSTQMFEDPPKPRRMQLCTNPKCRKEFLEGERFCTHCGTRVPRGSAGSLKTPPAEPPPETVQAAPVWRGTPAMRQCPNAKCSKPAIGSEKFCTACGTRLT